MYKQLRFVDRLLRNIRFILSATRIPAQAGHALSGVTVRGDGRRLDGFCICKSSISGGEMRRGDRMSDESRRAGCLGRCQRLRKNGLLHNNCFCRPGVAAQWGDACAFAAGMQGLEFGGLSMQMVLQAMRAMAGWDCRLSRSFGGRLELSRLAGRQVKC